MAAMSPDLATRQPPIGLQRRLRRGGGQDMTRRRGQADDLDELFETRLERRSAHEVVPRAVDLRAREAVPKRRARAAPTRCAEEQFQGRDGPRAPTPAACAHSTRIETFQDRPVLVHLAGLHFLEALALPTRLAWDLAPQNGWSRLDGLCPAVAPDMNPSAAFDVNHCPAAVDVSRLDRPGGCQAAE